MYLSEYPYIITYLYNRIHKTNSYLEKIMEIKDTFEFYARFISYILLAEYIYNNQRDEDREVYEKLILPTLGSWKDLILQLSKILKTDNKEIKEICRFFCNTAATIKEGEKLGPTHYFKILEDFNSFRNKKIGHGSAGTEDENKRLFNKWIDKLNTILENSIFLQDMILIVPNGKDKIEVWNNEKIQDKMLSNHSFSTNTLEVLKKIIIIINFSVIFLKQIIF